MTLEFGLAFAAAICWLSAMALRGSRVESPLCWAGTAAMVALAVLLVLG